MPSKTINELYSAADLAYYRREYADTEWMVHVIGPDDVLLHSDVNDDDPDHEPKMLFTLATADEMAKNINSVYERLQVEDPSPYNPMLHATVFHYGRPLVAPDAVAPAAPFSAEDLAWFKETWGASTWVAYVHGADECRDRRNDDDPPFTEETIRKFVTDMSVLDREMNAQGYTAPMAVSVFCFGEPFDLSAVAQ
jgi:hypothetical protein